MRCLFRGKCLLKAAADDAVNKLRARPVSLDGNQPLHKGKPGLQAVGLRRTTEKNQTVELIIVFPQIAPRAKGSHAVGNHRKRQV